MNWVTYCVHQSRKIILTASFVLTERRQTQKKIKHTHDIFTKVCFEFFLNFNYNHRFLSADLIVKRLLSTSVAQEIASRRWQYRCVHIENITHAHMKAAHWSNLSSQLWTMWELIFALRHYICMQSKFLFPFVRHSYRIFQSNNHWPTQNQLEQFGVCVWAAQCM